MKGKKTMANVQLIVIDPQVDFCDPKGALSVAGADKDMERLAETTRRCGRKIDDINVTLDSHRTLHIASPVWWVDENGKNPDPFTLITEDDVVGKNPKWRATNVGFQKRSEDYVRQLAKNGRYVLCIWPPHCLIGSAGYAVFPVLFEQLVAWEREIFGVVNYVTKGSNIFTEHYSAVKADVPDSNDPTSMLNTQFISRLQQADLIGITGQALSHCVANTIVDVADNFGEENIKKFVLIEDTTSSVTGFEGLGEDFVKNMTSRGMQVCKSDEFLT
jgi:nicotinamidase-related amidase